MSFVARMRRGTDSASDTGAPFATASTSSTLSVCPSITIPLIIAGMSARGHQLGKAASQAAARPTIALAVVIELQVGLRLEGDEEAEREVPVRRLQDREGRLPVMHVAEQVHHVARE